MENNERVWVTRLYVCLVVVLPGTFGLMNIVYPLVTTRLKAVFVLAIAIIYGLYGNLVGLFPWPPWRTTRR